MESKELFVQHYMNNEYSQLCPIPMLDLLQGGNLSKNQLSRDMSKSNYPLYLQLHFHPPVTSEVHSPQTLQSQAECDSAEVHFSICIRFWSSCPRICFLNGANIQFKCLNCYHRHIAEFDYSFHQTVDNRKACRGNSTIGPTGISLST